MRVMIRSVQTSGIQSLWVGLSSGLLRQVFYGTFRFGTFQSLQDYFLLKEKQKNPTVKELNFFVKLACGIIAGAVGGYVFLFFFFFSTIFKS